ncbi:MAG: ATP-binding cassette domain-containing protein [Euryarchaeota archaeon]|nr:ATP-binding cassette domain-containing protein [Euryarchaeota archaeon]
MFLKIENLSIDLGEFKLEDASLSVEQGEYAVLIGPTGSGKSILLETIAGFYRPEHGSIKLKDKELTVLPPEKRNVSVVYQDYMLFPHMNVYDNIAYGIRKKRRSETDIEQSIEKVSNVLKIKHLLHRHPDTLSGGEQQRVAIARALVVEPELLLMDEPFSALDIKTREELRTLVKDAMNEYRTTVIHVTHDFEDVFALATQVAVLHEGKIIQVGTPEEVFSRPVSEFVADFVGTNALRCTIEKKEDSGCMLNCNGVKLWCADSGTEGDSVTVAIRPESIIISREMVHTSARNVLQGTVQSVVTRGHLTWVTVKVQNITLRVVITPNSAELLNIHEGVEVYLIFKASGVRMVR